MCMKVPAQRRQLVAVMLVSLGLGWWGAHYNDSKRYSETLAMSRGFFSVSFSTNPASATAAVTLRQVDGRYHTQLELEVTTEAGTGYRHRELGTATSTDEAVRQWALIDWRKDGLHVGRGSNEFFMSTSELDSGWR